MLIGHSSLLLDVHIMLDATPLLSYERLSSDISKVPLNFISPHVSAAYFEVRIDVAIDQSAKAKSSVPLLVTEAHAATTNFKMRMGIASSRELTLSGI
jgi:hypothetical protein